VLATSNRVIRAEDFRAVMRGGKRVGAQGSLVYFRERGSTEPARFGFVIPRAVGGAVVRNRLRRRLRAIGYDLVASGFAGTDVVVRALPASAQLDWQTLNVEVRAAIQKGTRS
jgi:ribonuclease P protein component